MSELNNKIIERFLGELDMSSPRTKKDRAFYARKFLDFAGDKPLWEWNKSLVQDFERQLKAEGYAAGTCRTVFGIVKRVFDAAKLAHEEERNRLISEVDPNEPSAVAQLLKNISTQGPIWDVGKRSVPRVEASDVVKPAATFQEIKAMIEVVKDGVLGAAAAVYLALASIYGLRRVELCRVRKEHLNFGDKTIYVLSAKGGERRNQLLCDEVIPYLGEYDFRTDYSVFQMDYLYKRIQAKAGVAFRDGGGLHEVRRFLDTFLRDSLVAAFRDENVKLEAQFATKVFLRWKLSSSSEMTDRYYTKDLLEVDNLVLQHHPVVPLWR